MTFVFGSSCTFCFHMLMYLFDEKCVLFPKLLSIASLRHNVIYEQQSFDKDTTDTVLPLDFLATQWVDKSVCYLPTYVPLISGISGLIWTTMFLMCYTGSSTLTGLHRPWRVLPPVFIFSMAMGLLCVYSSAVTHFGLQELCVKLGEITGSSSCAYTINVATLAYERRIRGVYQAIRLTMLSAWLHTICWLLSAIMTMARVVLAVDFQLVRVQVDLRGDINRLMDHQEKQIRIVAPDLGIDNRHKPITALTTGHVRTQHSMPGAKRTDPAPDNVELIYKRSNFTYQLKFNETYSKNYLVPEESMQTARTAASKNIPRDKRFIIEIVNKLIQNLPIETGSSEVLISQVNLEAGSEVQDIVRQSGQRNLTPEFILDRSKRKAQIEPLEGLEITKLITNQDKQHVKEGLGDQLVNPNDMEPQPSTSKGVSPYTPRQIYDESQLNITKEMRDKLKSKVTLRIDDDKVHLPGKSLKHDGVQVGKSNLKPARKQETENETTSTNTQQQDIDKETQTSNKEKQD